LNTRDFRPHTARAPPLGIEDLNGTLPIPTPRHQTAGKSCDALAAQGKARMNSGSPGTHSAAWTAMHTAF